MPFNTELAFYNAGTLNGFHGVLVIHRSMTSHPDAQQFRTTNIYRLRDSEGLESRSGPAGWFWLQSAHKDAVTLSAAAAVSQRAGELAPRLTPVPVTGLCSVLAATGDFGSSGFPIDRLSVPVT